MWSIVAMLAWLHRTAFAPDQIFLNIAGLAMRDCDIMHTLILHVVYYACMYLLVVIYTCINTLPYGNHVLGKHSCCCNILTNTFVNMCACMYSHCSINSVALYLVFIAVFNLLIKSITILFHDATETNLV